MHRNHKDKAVAAVVEAVHFHNLMILMVVALMETMRRWMPVPAPGRVLGGDRTRTSDTWIGVFVAGSPFDQVSKWVMSI